MGDNTGRSGNHGWPNISQVVGPDVIYNPDAPLQNKQVGSLMNSYCMQSGYLFWSQFRVQLQTIKGQLLTS